MAAVLAAKLNPNFKAFTEVILFHVPGVKRLFFETEVSRFGFVLGTLLEAGLPIVNALQSLSGSMSTRRYQVFTSELATRINEGNSFERILVEPKARALLAGSTCQIIISAEKSGNLSKSLLRVGENYQEKADITARNLETLIEPVVLVIIAAGVLFVALAVFLPIYSVVGNFNANG
jgi:type II secretory pathway component PulF